jgi:hypothetical protein
VQTFFRRSLSRRRLRMGRVGSFRFEPRLTAEIRHKVELHGKSVAKLSGVANDPMACLARDVVPLGLPIDAVVRLISWSGA